MRKMFCFLPLALLVACSGGSSDGYQFEHAETNHSEVLVSFVDYDTVPDFQRAAKDHGAIQEGRDTQAFSVLNRKTGACQIHMVNPTKRYKPEWLGHEVYHCRYGRFHK